MSQRASPTLIGAFVVGAVVLALGGILLLGSADLFRETYPFVCYFPDSVNGLREGAAVKFKGVEIGTVDRIRLPLPGGSQDPPITVFFSLDAEELRSSPDEELDRTELAHLIEGGLRVRLQQESIVTGILYLSLEFVPDSEIVLHGLIPDVPEIPTVSTEFEQVANQAKQIIQRFSELDLTGLVNELQTTVREAGELVGSEDARRAISSLEDTLTEVGRAASTLEEKIGPLAEDLQVAATRIEEVADGLQIAITDAREAFRSLETLAASLERTSQELGREVQTTLADARALIDPASPPLVRLEQALSELGATARAARAMLDVLERDPDALLRGKGEPLERP